MTEATRRLLLDAGRRHFARHGLEGARVDSIAGEAGVNKALINYHFRGKQGLYEAVMSEATEALETDLAGKVGGGAGLEAWPAALAELLTDQPDLAPLLLGERLRQPGLPLPGESLLAARGGEAAPLLRLLLGNALLSHLDGASAQGRTVLERLLER